MTEQQLSMPWEVYIIHVFYNLIYKNQSICKCANKSSIFQKQVKVSK